MLRRHSDVPAVIVGPDDDAEASAQGWPAHSLVTPLNLPSGSLPCFDYARDRRPEYGFRLHKVPALLRSPFTELTVFLDADVLVCSPPAFAGLAEVSRAWPDADLLLMREGARAHDHINYVHGGLLAYKSTPLARAFLRTWLRRYLVEYKRVYELPVKRDKRGRFFPPSAFEQPALTETTASFEEVIGGVHYLPSALLARLVTGQLGVYRDRTHRGMPAAGFLHINPLKREEWAELEWAVTGGGAGANASGDGPSLHGQAQGDRGEMPVERRILQFLRAACPAHREIPIAHLL